MNWWCPPMYLIPRILRHAQTVNVGGYWWSHIGRLPRFGPLSASFAPFVCDWCDLPLSDQLFLNGRASSGFFSCGMPTSRVLALLLDFRVAVSPPLVFR